MGETYHSRFGAIQESRHVFIEHGLKLFRHGGLGIQGPCARNSSGRLAVLEVGFGTGLNAFLTLIESDIQSTPVDYTSVEAHPLPDVIYQRLNYSEKLARPDLQNIFLRMHAAPTGQTTSLTKNFNFTKQIVMAQKFITPQKFDLIYFDAFAPDKQPEMWSCDMLKKMYGFLNDGGMLTTYCAKGVFRRHLKEIGFQVESFPGPPGKREMTVAEREGFEPSLRFPVNTLSKRAPSATRPSLQKLSKHIPYCYF